MITAKNNLTALLDETGKLARRPLFCPCRSNRAQEGFFPSRNREIG